MTSSARRTPWTAPQARAALAADAIAAVLIIVAALGSRDTTELSGQIPWLNLGVLGLGFTCVAHGSIFLSARRSIGHRIELVVPAVPVHTGADDAAQAGVVAWLWVPGTRRAHQPGCMLIDGKTTLRVDSAKIRRESLQRCEACG
jgi:hypothetical protein